MSVKKNFYSDNVSGAAPEILEALVAANAGDTAPYGADAITEGLPAKFSALFETDVEVYPVGTGTAANGLCASIVSAPYGAIYLSDAGHLHGSECGGPEFWSGGNARTVPVPSVDGKLAAAELARLADAAVARPATEVPPRAVSITQGTEASTVYTLSEIRAIVEVARERNLWVHMDGARLGNAVARLGCTPAEATWKAGVDVLSFGATKNGALAAEAVIFFDPEKAADFAYRRKRGGHLFSKMRFLSAQLDGYLADGLWLRNATHANRVAGRLAEGLAQVAGARLRYPTQANEVFIELPERAIRALAEAGFGFYRWGGESSLCLRLVAAFDSRLEDAEALIAVARQHAGPR